MGLTFHIDDYSVNIDGMVVKLLRKEYLLLQYLHEYVNKALSRQQLLDAVWPLQVPSDRTVDDHIYRLRKKLKPLSHLIKIETVKGYGYKLVFTEQSRTTTLPFSQDQEIRKLTENLIYKYHLYGQGEAIHQLLDKNTFGLQLDEEQEATLHFLQGDFITLLRSSLPFEKRAFPLLGLDVLLEDDVEKMQKTLIKYEQSQNIAEPWYHEDIGLFRILIDIKSDRLKEAHARLVESNERITTDMPGFYGFYQVWWLLYALCAKNHKLAEEKIETLEQFFEKQSFQREYGLFLLLKGYYLLQRKQRTKALDLISQSFTIIEKTKFAMHMLVTLFVAEKLTTIYHDKEAAEMVWLKKEEVNERYRLSEVKKLIKKEFDENL
ncbi:winged helix-turn-helix domain-containing protein [Bacillus shivajii]|uniref:winged helix-turn-helix domain-containing protein n=1 Tax=Bacillus shivajii TaxID=1983719 RepID=UPI001CFC015F|nr:winged helix-turn-helix domain-containing protein [Bacillus shivajii]UCZ53427.1 winged helix-turn-helix domain-containing protein [Bacillus shivajii]